MAIFTDLSGMTFGSLTVIKREVNIQSHSMWLCGCTCGNTKIIRGGSLKSGSTRSCGCILKEINKQKIEKIKVDRKAAGLGPPGRKHGMSGTALYNIYNGMLQRCYNKNSSIYKYYGGRGVTVCDKWRESFINFLEDMGARPEGMSLDRIEGSLVYSKETTKWASSKTQGRNKGKFKNCKSGKTGVCKYGKYWKASYSDPVSGKLISKHFNIEKLGNESAFILACEWRDNNIARINKQGAGYSATHGA